MLKIFFLSLWQTDLTVFVKLKLTMGCMSIALYAFFAFQSGTIFTDTVIMMILYNAFCRVSFIVTTSFEGEKASIIQITKHEKLINCMPIGINIQNLLPRAHSLSTS